MQLVIQTGPAAGKQFDLGGKPLMLGKNPELEISVPDATMAGQHARFENIGGAVFVADLGSGIGTYLNGQRMSPGARYPLRPDDTLQIGATTFQIIAPVAAVSSSPEAPANGLAAPPDSPIMAAPAQPSLQPYQYQISKVYSPAKLATPVPAKQTVQKASRKIHWPSIIAALVVVVALNAAVIYFISSNTSKTLEIKTTGEVSRAPVRFTPVPTALPPTNTPDLSGKTFSGSTPGIGASSAQTTPLQLSPNDLPVYPGARRVDNPTGAVYFTQYITSDSFDKLSDWAKTSFSDKGWTNVEMKNLPGKEGAVLTGKKGNLSAVTYLLGSGQRDTAPYDNFFKSANVDPGGGVVVITITVS